LCNFEVGINEEHLELRGFNAILIIISYMIVLTNQLYSKNYNIYCIGIKH